MAFGLQETLKFLMTADGSQAIREFQKVSNSANTELEKAGKTTKTFASSITGGLDSFAGKVPAFQGALDKVGVSTTQLGSALAIGIPAAGAAAGVAIGKFAVDGATAFENLALQVSAFSKATGLSTVEASKFIEVAKDLKIDPSTFENAFVKMEKAISTNRKAFGDLVVTAKDGSIDLTQTFLNVVKHLQSIKDPIDRANESAKLFGRGFTGITEILGQNADDLAKRLDDVGTMAGKIITPAEVKQAEQYRDAMDHFHDSVENIQLEIGQALIPALTSGAQSLGDFVTEANKLAGLKLPGVGTVGSYFGEIISKGNPVIDATKGINDALDGQVSAWGRVKNAYGDFVPFLNKIPGLHREAANSTKESTNATADQIAVTEGMTRKVDLYEAALAGAGATMQDQAGTFRQAEESSKKWADVLDHTATSMDRLGAANDHDISSTQALAAQHRAAADEIKRQDDALQGLITAQLSSLDSNLAQRQALLSFQQGLQQVNADQLLVAKGGKDLGKNQQALANDLASSEQGALSYAGAALKAAQDQAALNGKTLTAKQSQDILVQSLQGLVAHMNGPLADAIRGDIFRLQTLGAQKPKPTADVDDRISGKVPVIQKKINDLSGKTVTVDVNANTSPAEQSLNAFVLANENRNVTVQVNARPGQVVRQAIGGASAGGPTLLAEQGPELVDLPAGSYVHPAGATQRMLGTTYNDNRTTIINAPTGTSPREVVAYQARYERRNGTRV